MVINESIDQSIFKELSLHSSFYLVQERLKKWTTKFSHVDDPSIFSDLLILYLTAPKKFLDFRAYTHLFRLALSIFVIKKKLSRSITFFPNKRSVEIHWIPATLHYPFSYKKVLGCLIGFNLLDRYEAFDEENILLVIQKYLPNLGLVKDSSYCHSSQHKNLKFFYLEMEKNDGKNFSLEERILLNNKLQDKIKNTIQILSPTIFMSHNEEETYKNILLLSQEIQFLDDIPQAYITLDCQTGKEIIFFITLVYAVKNGKSFSFENCLGSETFTSQRVVTVKQLKNHPIEAHIFRIHLPRSASLLRSDGSLDFYFARQKVADLIKSVTGEFRDYNGGIIIKQQELLYEFKENFPEITHNDSELIESFFYAITPIQKQVILPIENLFFLFKIFLENRKYKLENETTYSFKTYHEGSDLYLLIHGNFLSVKEVVPNVIKQHQFLSLNLAHTFVETEEGLFFLCLIQEYNNQVEPFLETLKDALSQNHKKIQEQQILRIGMDYSTVSLDPRIAGDTHSTDIIRLLFEGLTRFDEQGNIENAIAESIKVSADLKSYTFKLHPTLWNNGSPLTAYDFEYAWKKILSPTFKTVVSHLFHPIKNAQEAKAGKVPLDQIGIHVLNDLTLQVDLKHPTPYFLELTANSFYSPVHRSIDLQHPEWQHQNEQNYPCNGPFQLKINQPSQGFQLIKNPNYRDNHAIVLDKIFLTHMNPTQGYQAFQKNEVDWLGNPFGTWDPSYTESKEKDNKVIYFPDHRICWCTFNTNAYPFNNRRLRHAFAYAIERSQIQLNEFASVKPIYSIIPRHQKNISVFFPDHDKNISMKNFNEALNELGTNKKEFHINLICNRSEIQINTAVALKQQFKTIFDIECSIIPLPWGEQFKQMVEGEYEIGLVNWTPAMEDPIYTLSSFKSSGQDVNFSKWENFEFQRLLDLSEQEIDPKKRYSYLLEAEKILSKEMPIVPLFHFSSQALIRKNLQIKNFSSNLSLNVARSFYINNNNNNNNKKNIL
jgi:oligopeptide transport system substrate-binding protein